MEKPSSTNDRYYSARYRKSCKTGRHQARLGQLEQGQEVVGTVRNITSYGAFVDLGGVVGLLHINDMAWEGVKHPAEVLNVGDEISVKILILDREKKRVSLGIKQLSKDPWGNIYKRYPAGVPWKGVVTNITDFGCFVELEKGMEGLVHMSELDWTNKGIHPDDAVKCGEKVEVVVLGIAEGQRRISLSIKQCQANPQKKFPQGSSRSFTNIFYPRQNYLRRRPTLNDFLPVDHELREGDKQDVRSTNYGHKQSSLKGPPSLRSQDRESFTRDHDGLQAGSKKTNTVPL